jgi:hypothetical protein
VPEPDRATVVADHPQTHGQLAERAAGGQRLEQRRIADQHHHDDQDPQRGHQGAVHQRRHQVEQHALRGEQHDEKRELGEQVDEPGQRARAEPGDADVQFDGVAADQPQAVALGRVERHPYSQHDH